jgi:hypothetical protein
MSNRIAHQANLAVTTFVDHHHEPRSIGTLFVASLFDKCRLSITTENVHSLSQTLNGFVRNIASDDNVIFLLNAELRVSQSVGEVAVICTNDDPLGFFVETSDRSQHHAEVGQ